MIAVLHHSFEYQKVLKEGKTLNHPLLRLVYLRGPQRRLGLVVSAKVGNAVERNRIKRILREFFRLHLEKFPSGDSVLLARPGLAAQKPTAIRQALQFLLEKMA